MPERTHRLSQQVGLGGLFLFAALSWAATAAAFVGLALMILAAIGQIKAVAARLRGDPVVWIALAFVLYVIVRAVLAARWMPALATHQWRDAASLSQLWLFIIAGWWLAGNRRRIHCVLGLALASFLVATLIDIPWNHLEDLLHGTRSGLGTTTLALALYAGTGLLGWVAFAPRIIGWRKRRAWLRIVAWIAVAALLAQIVVIAQSRAIWLSLVVLLPFMLIARLHSLSASTSGGASLIRWAPVAILVVVVGAVFVANWQTIADRFSQEHRTIDQIAELDFKNIPATSIGLRVYMNELGFKRFAERPVFGWGPGTSATQDLREGAFPQVEQYADTHNAYLEILVRLGVTGLLLFGAAIVLLCRRVWKAFRNGSLDRDLMCFLVSCLVLNLLWSLINARMVNLDYRFYTILLVGIAYSASLPTLSHAVADDPESGQGLTVEH